MTSPTRISTDSTEEILRFLPASERSTEIEGEIALRLVFQVAEVIRGTEDRANTIEKRAQSLVESAVDELKHAGDLIKSWRLSDTRSKHA